MKSGEGKLADFGIADVAANFSDMTETRHPWSGKFTRIGCVGPCTRCVTVSTRVEVRFNSLFDDVIDIDFSISHSIIQSLHLLHRTILDKYSGRIL